MPRTRTTFQAGHRGMGGRPIGSKDRLPRGSVKAAWLRVMATEPQLIEEAIRAGLTAGRPSERLGFLELGAKLLREIGPAPEPEAAPDRLGVRIVLALSSEASALDAGTNADRPALPPKSLRALPV